MLAVTIQVPKCIAWQLFGNMCTFYSVVNTFAANTTSYYVGHKSTQPFWDAPSHDNTWYYQSTLGWVLQGTVATKAICYENCFFKWGSCKSWLYNEVTKDCYHSNVTYEAKSNVSIDNVHTGKVLLNFSPPTI